MTDSMSKQVNLGKIDPYHFRNINPVNRAITEEYIGKIFKKFGIEHKINNLANYQVAFVHTSFLLPGNNKYITDQDVEPLTMEEYQLEMNRQVNPDGSQNMMQSYFDEEVTKDWVLFQPKPYEILEFLGDSILSTVITDYMIERYPNQDEEFYTKLKTQLVRGTNLCILAKRLKFNKYLLVSRKSEYLGLRQNDDILEDVLEAFIGAMFTDFGRHAQAFGICKDFIVRLMERYLNMNQMARRRNNYKDILLQYFHKSFSGENPRYQLISTHGPTNNRTFKAGVLNTDGHMITTGEGSKLVFAEQEAAKEALKYYGQEVYSDSEEPDHQVYTYSDIED